MAGENWGNMAGANPGSKLKNRAGENRGNMAGVNERF